MWSCRRMGWCARFCWQVAVHLCQRCCCDQRLEWIRQADRLRACTLLHNLRHRSPVCDQRAQSGWTRRRCMAPTELLPNRRPRIHVGPEIASTRMHIHLYDQICLCAALRGDVGSSDWARPSFPNCHSYCDGPRRCKPGRARAATQAHHREM